MDKIDFDTYRSACLAEGFDEVIERVWPPDSTLATHTHPFSVKARVVQGEMWLTVQDETRHLQAGDGFELERRSRSMRNATARRAQPTGWPESMAELTRRELLVYQSLRGRISDLRAAPSVMDRAEGVSNEPMRNSICGRARG